MRTNCPLVLSMGDPNGIGPEVILKSVVAQPELLHKCVVIGHFESFEFYHRLGEFPFSISKILSIDEARSDSQALQILSLQSEGFTCSPGVLHADAGKLSMQCIALGVELCLQKKASALVTAPIHKAAISLAGYAHPGHTEYLAELCGVKEVLMMLVSDTLRVALATIHIPLSQVATRITKELVHKKLHLLEQALRSLYQFKRPKIAVLGLNPHAGDEGVIGREELDIITPALHSFQTEVSTIDGPFPADGFFANRMYQKYDAILAMYHDQGLIPFKTLSFNDGVNLTAGLPIIRTSPDHGTAFAIAGKNNASADSFGKAVQLALVLSNL